MDDIRNSQEPPNVIPPAKPFRIELISPVSMKKTKDVVFTDQGDLEFIEGIIGDMLENCQSTINSEESNEQPKSSPSVSEECSEPEADSNYQCGVCGKLFVTEPNIDDCQNCHNSKENKILFKAN